MNKRIPVREDAVELLTVKQAAARLGVSRERVHQLMREGRLAAVKLGRDWLIEERALAAVAVRPAGRAGWRQRPPAGEGAL